MAGGVNKFAGETKDLEAHDYLRSVTSIVHKVRWPLETYSGSFWYERQDVIDIILQDLKYG